MITPSSTQISAAKSWTELFKDLGLNPRNDRACKKVKDFVRESGEGAHLERYRASAGKYQDDAFAELVARSISIRQMILEGGWKEAGGTYAMLHKRIRRQGLDTSHFLGMGAGKGKTGRQKPVEEYLVENCYSIHSTSLKKKLFKSGLKEEYCECCGITEWLGLPAPLQLDHVSGDNTDNRIENLRILCAMCHALTPTHSGKNRFKKDGAPDRT